MKNEYLNDSLLGLKIVFSNFRYITIAFVVAVAFYLFNILISNWNVIISIFNGGILLGVIFLFKLFIGFKEVIPISSFYSLIATSILFGILLSIIVFKLNLKISTKRSTSVIGGAGMILGALVPGCLTCGIGLAATLGLSGIAFNFLPYKGLEIAVISIVLLGAAVIQISMNLVNCDECQDLIDRQLKGGRRKWLKRRKKN